MKKSIFLFFAAILCAMNVNAWSLMGEVTDWSTGKEMTGDSKVVSVTVNLQANKTLKLKIKNGSTWYGNSGIMTSTNNLAWGFSNTENSDAKITTKDAGDYTFTWYISDKKLSVTYPNHNYIIAGDGAVMEDEWSPSSTNNKMSKQDDGTYRLTKTNRSLSVKTYGYKLTVGSWSVNQYPNDNVALKVTTAGNYNVVFTYNPKNGQLSHELVPIYTITTSANPATAGTITGAGTYEKDASVTLEATPNAGYKFVNWTVGGVEKSTDAKYSFTASANVTAVANFELSDPEVPTYAISVSANDDAMGTITGAGDYTEGSPVTLIATPYAGYRFVNWTVGGEVKSTEATYSFTASEALTIVANFEAIPKYDITVKAVVPETWTSTTIGIHYWGDGISGTSTPVATEKDGNWNKYTIKDVLEGQSVNVIFLNGTSWGSDKSKQTANITGITEDKCFQISAKTLDGEGKCTFTEVDCAADIKPEGDVYTMMGVGELGLSWDLATTGNDMTKQTDGTYTLVKEGLDLATTGNYEYKVIKNHNWEWSVPSGNTNQKLTVDKDGTYTITFTLSADKKTLTAKAVCTAEKEVILDCFVAGTINLVGGTTDFTDELPMTYDEGTKTYSKTFTALAAGNYQMKVVYGSDWLGYDKLTKPIPANVTEGDDKKIKFSLAEAGDVTVTYNVEKGIGLVGTFADPVISYVLMGVNGDWTTGIKLVRNEANTDYEEYMLLNQPIVKTTDAVKVVKLVDGEKTTYCGKAQVKEGSVTCEKDDDDNIVLADGKYNFYYAVADNQVYIAKVEAPAVKSGKFSTGKYEYAEFAPGNLQYNTSNGTWHFAQNQYDYVGEANINVGDPNYRGWIDMFGWSTNDEGNNYGVNPKNVNELYDGTFVDWSNLFPGEGWSTLSKEQWDYLLNERDASLKQIAKVGDVLGIMLFPDNWTMPSGINVTAEYDNDFEVNVYNYTLEQWTKLEKEGAIFLPAAGRRAGGYGNMINKDQEVETNPANLNGGHYKHQDNTNIYCYYWTSTINESTKDVSYLHNIQALGGDKYTIGTGAIWGEKGRYGQSVRLAKVTDITPETYTRTVTNGNYGTICLPYASSNYTGMELYEVSWLKAETGLYLDQLAAGAQLVAGKPYIFKATATEITVTYTGDAKAAPVAGANGLTGTFTEIATGDAALVGNYIIAQNQIWVAGANNSLPANRAYINATLVPTTEQPKLAGRRRVCMGENAATGLDNITNGENTTIKVIENGQLIIIRNGEKFNAQGVRF